MNISSPIEQSSRVGLSRFAVAALTYLLLGYKRFISPMLGDRCRFYPYCSDYSMQALQTHGLLKGLILTAIRLLRCHPWCEGGIDEVPLKGRWRSSAPQILEIPANGVGSGPQNESDICTHADQNSTLKNS